MIKHNMHRCVHGVTHSAGVVKHGQLHGSTEVLLVNALQTLVQPAEGIVDRHDDALRAADIYRGRISFLKYRTLILPLH